ncbi:hypothetical protein SAMN05444157_1967 [Frankineae bacterium MT45]|nr:hypothetical protein SAMN05444157_1967 [Frankineae bacterium MT45]
MMSAQVSTSRPRRLPFALLIMGLVLGGLCALLALNIAAAADELRRHELAATNQDLVGEVQQLSAQVAAAQAPAALATAATKLGMVPAGNPSFLVIAPNGKASVRGTPVAAVAPPTPTPTPTPAPTTVPIDGAPR